MLGEETEDTVLAEKIQEAITNLEIKHGDHKALVCLTDTLANHEKF